MADPTDKVLVLRAHLEAAHDALEKVYGYLYAQDLAAGYREVKPNVRPSRLTVLTSNALDHVQGYLEEEDD